MYAEAAVDGGAVDAEEDAVGDGGPGRVLGVAVEAHLRAHRDTVRVRGAQGQRSNGRNRGREVHGKSGRKENKPSGSGN